jgi:RecJ-like exonuclease
MESDRIAFDAKLAEMAAEFKKRDDWALVTNYDCDGLTSGAIIATTMQRLGMSYKPLVLKQLYPEHITPVRELGSSYIFIDFGSGQLDFLRKEFGEDFFVLDHHQPLPVAHRLHANPMLFGFNGGTELSAAGLAYLFAKTVDERNTDLSALAVIGAMGDIMDATGKLIGLNSEIADDGIRAGVLDRKTDLRLYGRISRPLAQFLTFATNPVLPQLTANEANCKSFLEGMGIPLQNGEKYRSYEDLSTDEKKKLSSALILHLDSFHVPEWKIKELIGEVYTLTREDPHSPLRDAKEFGTILNACGRWGRSDVGLSVCMGDRMSGYEEALSLLQKHRRELRDGITFMLQKGVDEKKWFYFFDAENAIPDSIIGIVAGMLYGSGNIGFHKAIIAFSRYEDGSIKASGRAAMDLVRQGLNLGKAFREICDELGPGNEGGGHKMAAGLKLEAKNRDLFLELLDAKIAQQLGQSDRV